MKMCDQPFILLVKCKSIQETNKDSGIQKHMQADNPSADSVSESAVFGAYCSIKNRVNERSFGDNESFLFSLLPYCNSFRYQENPAFSNFAFLGSSEQPGLGFGGTTADNSRIWIDRDMVNSSMVRDVPDLTFESGNIVPHFMKDRPIEVQSVELWVLIDNTSKGQLASRINE